MEHFDVPGLASKRKRYLNKKILDQYKRRNPELHLVFTIENLKIPRIIVAVIQPR